MATFNPEQQVQPEYPYFWARPTQEPKPDLSGEIKGKALGQAFGTAGEAISSGAQGITAAYEKGIQNTIYAGVDPLRDQYMEQLHGADQTLRAKEAPDPLGRDAPRDVKQLPGTLSNLDSARANGKLSQTDYDARLNSLAKEIRAKYPGFRQYVDEEFKRITGRDSANQYIRSVIQDIDSYVQAKNAKRDKFESELMSQGLKYKDGASIIQAYQKDPDKMRAPVMQWLNQNMAADHEVEQMKARTQFLTEAGNLEQKDSLQDLHVTAGKSATNYWSATKNWFAISAGHDTGDPQRQKMLLSLEQHDVDELSKYPKEQLANLNSQLQAWGEAKKVERFKSLRDAASPLVPDVEIKNQVDAEYDTLFKPYLDALGKPDTGLAVNMKRIADGAGADQYQAVLKDRPDLRAAYDYLNYTREHDPEAYKQLVQSEYYQKAINETATLIATHTAALAAKPGTPVVKSFNQVITDIQNKNQQPDVAKHFIEYLSKAGEKGPQSFTPEVKENLFTNAFGPDSSTILQHFAKDSYYYHEPGKAPTKTLGQQWVFNRFTSDDMIALGAKIGKDKPEIYENYRKFAESSIHILDHDVLTKDNPSFYDTTVLYNDKTGEFTFQPPTVVRQGRRIKTVDPYRDQALSDINSNFKRLRSIAEHDPSQKINPDVAVFNLLQEMTPDSDHSLVSKMVRAMAMAHASQ